MTIIEFYDKASIENIIGAMLCKPSQVILVGDSKKQKGDKIAGHYQEILQKRGINTSISYRSINKNNLSSIVDELTKIVEEYSDCVFDLTGGDELCLVAVGSIMTRYEGKVQCHRFNLRNETLCDSDMDGKTCSIGTFDISVEENISIYGGKMVTDKSAEFYTYPWNFSAEFLKDIKAMWEICQKNPRLWNAHVGTLGTISQMFSEEEALTVSFSKMQAESVINKKGYRYYLADWITQELQKHWLISRFESGDTIIYKFKNEQVKRCLTVAGQILELAVASKMMLLKDTDGQPLYHDVKVGVVIDWDEDDGTNKNVNEIDILAMKGVIPVFVSCKNGDFDVNELYKLNTVALRFGHKYAKKALASTELNRLGDKAEYIKLRMDDIGIRSIDNIDEISEEELERKLRSLWCN